MFASPMAGLSTTAPLRVLDGFGRAVHAACRTVIPSSVDELAKVLSVARNESTPVTFRGAGQSYGDAALGSRGIVVDTSCINRILNWDPVAGVVEAEPGVTIAQLWRHALADGYWPAVVPGTMRPTLAGCLAANVHGKNNTRVGTIGDQVDSFDLITGDGQLLECSRDQHADVFHAAIGGFGLLGAITRIRMRLHRVPGGRVQVRASTAANLDELMHKFEVELPRSDYVVGWIDGMARGQKLGRGEIHAASYAGADLDPDGARYLDPTTQDLPSTILGVPRSMVWRFLRMGTNRFGSQAVNLAKYWSARASDGKTYLQTHAEFAFLLDYVPNWRLAYGPQGFVQVQVFVPHHAARTALSQVLEAGPSTGNPPYLAVLKRHRPDPFLLTHGLDGWSLALDIPVPHGGLPALRQLTDRITAITLDAGGRFYFAKDAMLTPADVTRAWGVDKLATFAELRTRLDPQRLFTSDLADRVGLSY